MEADLPSQVFSLRLPLLAASLFCPVCLPGTLLRALPPPSAKFRNSECRPLPRIFPHFVELFFPLYCTSTYGISLSLPFGSKSFLDRRTWSLIFGLCHEPTGLSVFQVLLDCSLVLQSPFFFLADERVGRAASSWRAGRPRFPLRMVTFFPLGSQGLSPACFCYRVAARMSGIPFSF